MARKIKIVNTFTALDSAGKIVDALPVRDATGPIANEVGMMVDPIEVEIDDVFGAPVRYVNGLVTTDAAGRVVPITPITGGGVFGPAYQAQFAGYRFSNGQQRALAEMVSAVSAEGYALDADGYYVRFPANTPRVTSRGLLAEAGATNLLTYSATPTNASWTLTSAGATASQPDPARGATAHLITEVGTSGVLRRSSTVTVTAATAYVYGRILKRGNCDWVRFGVARETGLTNQSRAWFNLATGAVGTRNDAGTGCGGTGAGIIALGDGWYYCYLAFTAPTTACVPFTISAADDGNTSRFNNGAYSCWNDQLEFGSVPTSPIVTLASAIARAADDIKLKVGAAVLDLDVIYHDATTTTLAGATGNYALPTSAKYYASIISNDKAAVVWADPKFLVDDYDGSAGTDNTGGLLALLRHAKAVPVTLPAGSYCVKNKVELLERNLPAIYINGPATGVAEFVWDVAPTAGALLLIGSTDGTAERVEIVGGDDYLDCHIKLRINRASVRTANCDFLRLPGVKNYKVEGVAIPRADNMAIALRQYNDTFQPDSGYIRYCDIGELPVGAEILGDRGSVGDSGLWGTGKPPLVGEWSYNRIRGTGDDAAYQGHSTSTTTVAFQFHHNLLQYVSGGFGTSYSGIGVSAHNNTITRTVNAGIRGEVDSENSAIVADNLHTYDNVIEEVGFLTAANIGADALITQANPHALWLRGSNSLSERDTIRRCKARALQLQPRGGATQNGVVVEAILIEDGGCSDAAGTLSAWSGSNGLIHRSASSSGVLTNASISGTIRRTNQSLIEALPVGTSVDTGNTFDLAVEAIALATNPAVRIVATDTARAYWAGDIDILDGSVIITPKAVSGGASNAADVTVNLV